MRREGLGARRPQLSETSHLTLSDTSPRARWVRVWNLQTGISWIMWGVDGREACARNPAEWSYRSVAVAPGSVTPIYAGPRGASPFPGAQPWDALKHQEVT